MELWVVVSCQIWVLATEFWFFGKTVCVVTHRPICLIHIKTKILTKHILQECWRSNSGLCACKADLFQAEISPHLSHMFFNVYHFTLFSLDYSMLVHGTVPVVMYVVRKRMNQDYECQRSLHSAEGLQWVQQLPLYSALQRTLNNPERPTEFQDLEFSVSKSNVNVNFRVETGKEVRPYQCLPSGPVKNCYRCTSDNVYQVFSTPLGSGGLRMPRGVVILGSDLWCWG